MVFAAGVVRGFAGFGFSAITVAGRSLVVSPAQFRKHVPNLPIAPATVRVLRSVYSLLA